MFLPLSLYQYKSKMSAIKSMNFCVGGYLHLDNDGDIIKYPEIEDDASSSGNTEGYINKLEFNFKDPDEFDLDEEWDKFCEVFFNDWCNTGNNFYEDVDDWADLSCQFNSKEMIYLIKMVNDYWLETTGDPFDLEEADEEKIWNCIAFAWIRQRSVVIKKFVLNKIQEKFDEWLEEQNGEDNYPLTCDICYRNKQIQTYAACCNDKKFCGECYKKLKGKLCPFCRGEISHSVGDDEVCNQTGFEDWLFSINKSLYLIKMGCFKNCN
jgi:hypothetical protein